MDMVETWFSYHVASLISSTASCVALLSFLGSILPTKRNLFTFLDALLILAMTGCVDVMVRLYLKCWCDSQEARKTKNSCLECPTARQRCVFTLSRQPFIQITPRNNCQTTYRRSTNSKPKMPFVRGKV